MLEKKATSDFFKLRRLLIEREFAGLNDMQKKAAFAVEGPLLVLAGAGSGKTTVIVNRIANIIKFGNGYESQELPDGLDEADIAELKRIYEGSLPLEGRNLSLVAENPCPPWAIMAITFTNRAARELKERIAKRLTGEGFSANEVWAATFHSVCVRILRRDIEKLGYEGGFTIYDTDDSIRVIKDICKRPEINIDSKTFPPNSILNAISRAKENLVEAEQYNETYGDDYRNRRIGEVYKEYARQLRSANALDFDDIIMLTIRLFRENEEVLGYYQRRFRYILIDEYQDTNKAQYVFAGLISGHRRNLCVVGDDDQSIYSFRGAIIENILSFDKHFPEARVVNLEQNYRSTSNILDAANAVIKNNGARHPKKLWTDKGDGAKITIYRGEDERDEASYIANTIRAESQKGRGLGDFAVLYRLNALSNQMENAFKRTGLPYRIYGGTTFYTRAEVKDMLAYLCLLNNTADDARLKRIVNTPARKIGERTVDIAEQIAAQRGCSIYEVLQDAANVPDLSRAQGAIQGFVAIIDTLQSLKDTLPLDQLYDNLVELSGYGAALAKKGDEEAIGRLGNISELRNNIAEYIKQNEELEPNEAPEPNEDPVQNEAPTLGGFLEEVTLFTDVDRYDTETEAITMMTLHSAKGLEFPIIFICGAEEGMFPGMRSMLEPNALEEERRLAYVGITRAREQLFLTHATTRMMFGQTQYNRLSRFAEEIPADCAVRLPELTEKPRGRAAAPGVPKYRNGFPGLFEAEKPKPTVVLVDYKPGDPVDHKSFGHGVVLSCQPMAGDMLLEIAFDTKGTKRLLAKAASAALSRRKDIKT